MKNVQVIDGADNCSYEVFALPDDDFDAMFPNGADVEFISDFIARVGQDNANRIAGSMWKNRQDKKKIVGIHGTLFYELDHKKKFYPTKRESEMAVSLD